jgi:hypothetical protein
MSDPLANIRMIVLDWYDGPTGGVLIDPERAKAFQFYLLDWDSQHRIRLFALQEVSPTVVDSLFKLTSENPRWPVWYPNMLNNPTEEAVEWAGSVDGYRIRPNRVDSVLVWDSSHDRALGTREVDQEYQARTMPWFDAVDSASGALDWFRLLCLPRD